MHFVLLVVGAIQGFVVGPLEFHAAGAVHLHFVVGSLERQEPAVHTLLTWTLEE